MVAPEASPIKFPPRDVSVPATSGSPEVLPATMVFVSSMVGETKPRNTPTPPPLAAVLVLLVTVQLIRASVQGFKCWSALAPAPETPLEFPLIVQLVRVSEAVPAKPEETKMPPPKLPAELPVKVELVTVALAP